MVKILSKDESKKSTKINKKSIPTLQLKTERDIAMDFAGKVYETFDKIVKSIILFGSSTKNTNVVGSDIDIIIIVDDAIVKFDEKIVLWYRDELGKIIQKNPYKKDLHINTVKLTTWWDDLLKGDPVVVNILRFGEAMIDAGAFFNPLKILLQEGRIKASPEAMYTMLNRVPEHIVRSKTSEMSSIEGCYWAMVESAQALIMAIKIIPPSPEEIPRILEEKFVSKNLLKQNHINDFKDLMILHKRIIHGEIRDIDGRIIDGYQNKSEEFFKICMKLIDEIIK
jgi:predicted nucleotidyltransferase